MLKAETNNPLASLLGGVVTAKAGEGQANPTGQAGAEKARSQFTAALEAVRTGNAPSKLGGGQSQLAQTKTEASDDSSTDTTDARISELLIPGATSGELAAFKKKLSAELQQIVADMEGSAKLGSAGAASVGAETVARIVKALENFDRRTGANALEVLSQTVAQGGASSSDIVKGGLAAMPSIVATRVAEILAIDGMHQKSDAALISGNKPGRGVSSVELSLSTALERAQSSLPKVAAKLPIQPEAIGVLLDGGAENTGWTPSATDPTGGSRSFGEALKAASTSEATPAKLADTTLTQLKEIDFTAVKKGGITSVELRPHELGTLEIEVETNPAGNLRVVLRSDHPLVLDALRSERGGLAEFLQERSLSGADLSFESRGGERREQGQSAAPTSMTDDPEAVSVITEEVAPISRGAVDIIA